MLINGKPINPGELRTKIVLASKNLAQDQGGFQVPGQTLIAEVYARWINVHGQETWAASARGAQEAATVLIRYRPGIDETCVVLKGASVSGSTITGGKVFEIISMDNIQERNEYIELKVQRMVAG